MSEGTQAIAMAVVFIVFVSVILVAYFQKMTRHSDKTETMRSDALLRIYERARTRKVE